MISKRVLLLSSMFFRATSTIAAALEQGAKEIIPVAQVDECISLGANIPNAITGWRTRW